MTITQYKEWSFTERNGLSHWHHEDFQHSFKYLSSKMLIDYWSFINLAPLKFWMNNLRNLSIQTYKKQYGRNNKYSSCEFVPVNYWKEKVDIRNECSNKYD